VKLNVTLADKVFTVELPEDALRSAEEFYRKMDRDMDRGWQMSREFVENPNVTQRCQIAANRLMTSMSGGNTTMVELMAGYILTRLPGVTGVDIDTAGEMTETEFSFESLDAVSLSQGPRLHPEVEPRSVERPIPPPPRPTLNKLQALEQAGKQVSKVYKSGRGYRFAVLDASSGQWAESALADSEKDAEDQRLAAVKRRYEELLGAPSSPAQPSEAR
jgi:hypothetical protein